MSTFKMLVGLPGSGKSTFYKNNLAQQNNCVYLSSDEIREELFGDANIQGDPSKVFTLMQQRTLAAIKAGKDVIYDATNVSRKYRRGILKALPKDSQKVCIIIWARLETCIERAAERERKVSADVIYKIARRFQTPWYDEGFDSISINYTDDLYLLSELESTLNIPHDNPHHQGTILEHIERVKAAVKKDTYKLVNSDLLLDLAQYHDIGKAYTKSFVNSKGETTEGAHYYNHQNVSAYLTLGVDQVYAKRVPNAILKLSYLVGLHMELFFNRNPSNYWKNLDQDIKNLIDTFNKYDKEGA